MCDSRVCDIVKSEAGLQFTACQCKSVTVQDPEQLLVETSCVGAVGQLKQHKLTAYRAALVGVLKAQIKNERLEPGLAGVMQLADSVALKVRASSRACKMVLPQEAQQCHQNLSGCMNCNWR